MRGWFIFVLGQRNQDWSPALSQPQLAILIRWGITGEWMLLRQRNSFHVDWRALSKDNSNSFDIGIDLSLFLKPVLFKFYLWHGE